MEVFLNEFLQKNAAEMLGNNMIESRNGRIPETINFERIAEEIPIWNIFCTYVSSAAYFEEEFFDDFLK